MGRESRLNAALRGETGIPIVGAGDGLVTLKADMPRDMVREIFLQQKAMDARARRNALVIIALLEQLGLERAQWTWDELHAKSEKLMLLRDVMSREGGLTVTMLPMGSDPSEVAPEASETREDESGEAR